MLQYDKNIFKLLNWPNVHAFGWPSACVSTHSKGFIVYPLVSIVYHSSIKCIKNSKILDFIEID